MSAMSLFMAKWRSDNSSGWPVVSDSDFLFRPSSSRFSIAYSGMLLEAMTSKTVVSKRRNVKTDERAQKYAASVVEKERTGFMFQELNSRDSLRDLGIVICQDVLDIVQHAKRMCENEDECDARGAGDSKIQNKMEVEVR